MYSHRIRRWAIVLFGLLLSGCASKGPTPGLGPTAASTAVAMASPTARVATAAPTGAPTAASTPISTPQEIVVLFTTDEHGQLQPEESAGFYEGGALAAASLWRADGLHPEDQSSNALLLSGGDNWTGAAISTWFEGESAVELMNAMGYRAAALGNHDLDFGQDVLREREVQMAFPFLAANVYQQGSKDLSDLVQPYTLIDVAGVRVGIIGLALPETPSVTAAKALVGLEFGAAEPALRRWVPEVRAQGAQIVIALTHICADGLIDLAQQTEDLGISLYLGGHCHESMALAVGDGLVATGSSHWRDYLVVRLHFDPAAEGAIEGDYERMDVLVPVKAAKFDVALEQRVQVWDERVQTVLGETIGYSAKGLSRDSAALQNALVDSWLWSLEGAQVAISNVGGFRQDLPQGEITLSDMVGVLPFDNELYELELTGAQLRRALGQNQTDGLVLGGVRRRAGGGWELMNGDPIREGQTYRVVLTDYVYGNDKYPFKALDAEPYETSIHWRQPLIDWIKAQNSSAKNPLENGLDNTPRS